MRWIFPVVLVVSACASSTAADESVSSASPATSPAPAAAAPGVTAAPPQGSAKGSATASAATPTTSAATATSAVVSGQPAGFETTQAVVVTADGTTCELCVWLAESGAQRKQGLMGVTDLGVGDAMAFLYPEPHTGTFWMKNTILPLSIAFFAPDGTFMSSFDMEPCTTSDCPNYSTPTDFLVALEVPQGGLADLGVGPGSSLELLDLPCD